MPLGLSAQLKLGQGIVALGWAEGPDQSTVRRGVVTGLRTDGARQLVQTDTAPHPGDSGGPIVDRAGEVVGISTFRYNDGSGGLAVPIDDVKVFIETASGMAALATTTTPASPSAAPIAPTAAADPPRASETDTARQNGARSSNGTWGQWPSAPTGSMPMDPVSTELRDYQRPRRSDPRMVRSVRSVQPAASRPAELRARAGRPAASGGRHRHVDAHRRRHGAARRRVSRRAARSAPAAATRLRWLGTIGQSG